MKRAIVSLVFFFTAGMLSPQGILCAQDDLRRAGESFQQRDYIKARDLYQEAFLSAKGSDIAEKALLGLARAEYHLRRYHEANLNLRRFVSRFPKSDGIDEARLYLGYCSLRLDRLNDAQGYFERVGGQFRSRAALGTAEVMLAKGDIAAAEASFRRVDRKDIEGDAAALALRAQVSSAGGQHEEAVRGIAKIADEDARNLGLRAVRARIYYNGKKLAEAEKECRAVIDDPVSLREQIEAKKLLSQIAAAKGNTDEALRLKLALVPHETNDEFTLEVVSLYDKKGDTDGALKFVSFLKDPKIRSRELERRLKPMIETQSPEAMKNVLKYAPFIDRQDPFAVSAARFLMQGGRKGEGVELLRRISKGQQAGEAALVLAEHYVREGKAAEAKKLLSPLLSDQRQSLGALIIMADIMEQEGRPAEAVGYLQRAYNVSKDRNTALKLGTLYGRTGDRENAKRHYLAASEMGNGSASVRVGDLLYLSGERERARAFYKKALEQDIADRQSLQWTYYQYGKLSGDREYLKKASEGGGVVGEAAKALLGSE
ncbi:MAG TPA: tetratricopeptide repeat protein [Dissulfurispiraceae bacterium]|nr:tetratricopeptide repeat protein [Dissulfurispiraceae bacterium]